MRTNGIVSHDVVQIAVPRNHDNNDKRAEDRHHKAAVDLRVRLLEASGGEQNHCELSQADLAAMQHVIRWRIGEDTDHGAKAISHLESLKADALPGTPQFTVAQRIQTTIMNLKALLARKQSENKESTTVPEQKPSAGAEMA